MENDAGRVDRFRCEDCTVNAQAVEEAFSALRYRIQAINNDKNSTYTVSEAVAFGDFLSEDARVQPAEVGVRLTPRNTDVNASASAVEQS